MLKTLRHLLSGDDWSARRASAKGAEWWNRPREGCELRFGYAAQPELSGKSLTVDAHHLYRFEGSPDFISHRLSDRGRPCCTMIVASAGRSDVYLALSRKLAEREYLHLFSDEERSKLPDLSSVANLYVREHTPGIKDWVTMQYRRRIDGMRGEKIAPDGTATPFRYQLFVSEDNEKALEIEIYDDGRFDLHATLYRPVSDIVQLTERRPARPVAMVAPKEERPVRRKPLAAPALPPQKAMPAMRTTPKAAAPAAPREAKLELVVAAPAVTPAMQASPQSEDPSLGCNIRVAAKIIDEAIRNDLALSDVVRRILGLPVAIEETVHFHLPLSGRDYHLLAERYQLDPSEHDAIRALIAEDLIDFTGERHKAPLKKAYM